MLKASALSFAIATSSLAAAPPPEPTKQMKKVLGALQALGAKPPGSGTVEEARTGVTAKDAVMKVLKDDGKPSKPEDVGRVEQKMIKDVPVTVYTPAGTGPFPAIIYFHGGGFVLADANVYDASARALTSQARAIVISVDYRRAPEHPYPAALDDSSAVYQHVAANPKDFNVQPGKIAVAGESAGANLATAVTMRAKKDKAPLPIYQLLVYPFVSTDLTTASHRALGTGNFIISNADLAWFWEQYLGKGWKTATDAMAVPAVAKKEDLKGLPSAMVITAGLDPLKDQGASYAKQLMSAGIEVKTKEVAGVTHEFFGMAGVVDEAKQAQADAVAALTAAFSK